VKALDSSAHEKETDMFGKTQQSAAAFSLILASGVLATGCGSLPSVQLAETVSADSIDGSAVERGRYLVTVGGCNDCHTPFIMTERGPEPDPSRTLSGHPESVRMPPPPRLAEPWGWMAGATNTAFAGPWGVSYAFNLTPDENTGIGIWTEDMFLRTLRTGRHMGVSRPIMPPMPWQNFGRMTDEDLKAIFAYLRSVPPIHNRVPTPLEPREVAAMQ
jgi:mono/diheme cytochrome c family protein